MNLTGGEWTRRYESLRAHVMGEAPVAFVPMGLALLWHRGVAAWMAAESSATRVEAMRQGMAPLPQAPPHSELVRLLAGTALLVAQRRAS